MNTKYKVIIAISLINIILICISLYLMKLTKDNKKISNKNKIVIDTIEMNNTISLNKGYENYMSEIMNKEKIENCKSYNYGEESRAFGIISFNSSEGYNAYVDSINK